MARRIPLPHLTHRQRMARWQRERRQQAIYVTVFTAVLVFVLGAAAWGASDRYYKQNLDSAAEVRGLEIPKREYRAQLAFDLVRLYFQYGVPKGSESDPQIQTAKGRYKDLAVSQIVEERVLDLAAHDAGIVPTPQQIDQQYVIDYGEFRVRHVLVQIDKKATDQAAADAAAKAKAQGIADELRKSPNDQNAWNKIAKESSDDPGSKDAGGELGWSAHGQYVEAFETAARALAVGQISDPVRSQFGYHVIQLEETRDPAQTDIVKKYRDYGYGEADLKVQARYDALRHEFETRQQAALLVSPQEQVHIAKIVVDLPSPSAQDPNAFTAALKKQTIVRDALKSGTDFAEVAKTDSDDSATMDVGGEAGWVTRGMVPDPKDQEAVFGSDAGTVTDPVSTETTWTVYKILEKSPSRELTDDQEGAIKADAYQYWLGRQKQAYDVKNVIPGFALD